MAVNNDPTFKPIKDLGDKSIKPFVSPKDREQPPELQLVPVTDLGDKSIKPFVPPDQRKGAEDIRFVPVTDLGSKLIKPYVPVDQRTGPAEQAYRSVLATFEEQGYKPDPKGNIYIDPFLYFAKLFWDERITNNAFFIANEMVPRAEKTFTWGEQENFSGARQFMTRLAEELGNQVHSGKLERSGARKAVEKLKAELSKLPLTQGQAEYVMRVFDGSSIGKSILPQAR